jgi:hypothetical protein
VHEQAGTWPRVGGAGGPSIFLADVNAIESAENAWRISVLTLDGARNNKATDLFDKADIGSPGYVPGINGNPAATTPVTIAKNDRTKPKEPKENVEPPQEQAPTEKTDKPKDDTIDY